MRIKQEEWFRGHGWTMHTSILGVLWVKDYTTTSSYNMTLGKKRQFNRTIIKKAKGTQPELDDNGLVFYNAEVCRDIVTPIRDIPGPTPLNI